MDPMNALSWDAILVEMSRHGIRFQLHYDTDYGLDHKAGWSMTVQGRVVAQFCPTPEWAVREAIMDLFVGRG